MTKFIDVHITEFVNNVGNAIKYRKTRTLPGFLGHSEFASIYIGFS